MSRLINPSKLNLSIEQSISTSMISTPPDGLIDRWLLNILQQILHAYSGEQS